MKIIVCGVGKKPKFVIDGVVSGGMIWGQVD